MLACTPLIARQDAWPSRPPWSSSNSRNPLLLPSQCSQRVGPRRHSHPTPLARSPPRHKYTVPSSRVPAHKRAPSTLEDVAWPTPHTAAAASSVSSQGHYLAIFIINKKQAGTPGRGRVIARWSGEPCRVKPVKASIALPKPPLSGAVPGTVTSPLNSTLFGRCACAHQRGVTHSPPLHSCTAQQRGSSRSVRRVSSAGGPQLPMFSSLTSFGFIMPGMAASLCRSACECMHTGVSQASRGDERMLHAEHGQPPSASDSAYVCHAPATATTGTEHTPRIPLYA